MDKLKQYIRQHVHEIDADAPDDALWRRIQSHSYIAKNRKLRFMIRYLAAACILGLIIHGIWLLLPNQKTGNSSDNIVTDRKQITDSVYKPKTNEIQQNQITVN